MPFVDASPKSWYPATQFEVGVLPDVRVRVRALSHAIRQPLFAGLAFFVGLRARGRRASQSAASFL